MSNTHRFTFEIEVGGDRPPRFVLDGHEGSPNVDTLVLLVGPDVPHGLQFSLGLSSSEGSRKVIADALDSEGWRILNGTEHGKV